MNATLTTATGRFNALFGFADTCHKCGVALAAENTHPISDERGWCIECAERKMVQERMALFFEDVARMAKIQRAADKKAAAHAKKLDSLVVLGRATFKATSAQLYAVQSGEKTYHVTRIAGRVRSCVDAVTGETCKARYYGADHCCHGEAVEMMEAKRSEKLATTEQVAPLIVRDAFHSDMSAHVVDALAAPTDPWADENYDPFAGMTVMQRREAYRVLYPDDFAA